MNKLIILLSIIATVASAPVKDEKQFNLLDFLSVGISQLQNVGITTTTTTTIAVIPNQAQDALNLVWQQFPQNIRDQ